MYSTARIFLEDLYFFVYDTLRVGYLQRFIVNFSMMHCARDQK